MTDDPADVFDRFADDIRRRQDELDAAAKLRSDKAAEREKREPDAAAAADVEPPRKPGS